MNFLLCPRASRRVLGALLHCGVLCLLLAACANFASTEFDATDAEALRYAKSGDLRAEVDSVVQPLIGRGDMPGAVVGILLPDGSMRFFGYGVADRDTGRKPDADTLFAVGSLSKGFLGTIVDLLVQQGQLSWDNTLGEVIPPDAGPSPDARNITLLQLTTHTAGLRRQPFTRPMLMPFIGYLFTGDSFYDMLDRDFMFDYLSDFSTPRAPTYVYSNIGYGLLGFAVERKTGENLDVAAAGYRRAVGIDRNRIRAGGPPGLCHTRAWHRRRPAEIHPPRNAGAGLEFHAANAGIGRPLFQRA